MLSRNTRPSGVVAAVARAKTAAGGAAGAAAAVRLSSTAVRPSNKNTVKVSGTPASVAVASSGTRAYTTTAAAAAASNLTFFQKKSLPTNTVVRFVPQQTAWVVERMGKFHRILPPGLAVLFPLIDKIQYVQSLKENAIEIPSQSAITSDNVTLEMDGVLYIKVVDAYKASYGVENAEYAISQLAQTTMRSEIGQLTLDHVLKERQNLNSNITRAINEAAESWGIQCLRYEIRDIHPPANVLEAMHRQVSAERSKRAEILESEGQRQSDINIAEGQKQSTVLASEGKQQEIANQAAGEAQAILTRARAEAEGIKLVAKAINETPGGKDAVALQVAEKYVDAFGKLAKESNTVVIPAELGNVGSWISGGMSIYEQLQGKVGSAAIKKD